MASLPALLGLQTEFLPFGGILCALVLAWLAVWVFVCVWVYKDAERRGMGGVLWVVVVLVAGLIGLLIYFVVRGSHPERPAGYAPWPGAPMYAPPGYGYAPPPGPPPMPGTPCKNCGAPLAQGAGFCGRCGTKV